MAAVKPTPEYLFPNTLAVAAPQQASALGDGLRCPTCQGRMVVLDATPGADTLKGYCPRCAEEGARAAEVAEVAEQVKRDHPQFAALDPDACVHGGSPSVPAPCGRPGPRTTIDEDVTCPDCQVWNGVERHLRAGWVFAVPGSSETVTLGAQHHRERHMWRANDAWMNVPAYIWDYGWRLVGGPGADEPRFAVLRGEIQAMADAGPFAPCVARLIDEGGQTITIALVSTPPDPLPKRFTLRGAIARGTYDDLGARELLGPVHRLALPGRAAVPVLLSEIEPGAVLPGTDRVEIRLECVLYEPAPRRYATAEDLKRANLVPLATGKTAEALAAVLQAAERDITRAILGEEGVERARTMVAQDAARLLLQRRVVRVDDTVNVTDDGRFAVLCWRLADGVVRRSKALPRATVEAMLLDCRARWPEVPHWIEATDRDEPAPRSADPTRIVRVGDAYQLGRGRFEVTAFKVVRQSHMAIGVLVSPSGPACEEAWVLDRLVVATRLVAGWGPNAYGEPHPLRPLLSLLAAVGRVAVRAVREEQRLAVDAVLREDRGPFARARRAAVLAAMEADLDLPAEQATAFHRALAAYENARPAIVRSERDTYTAISKAIAAIGEVESTPARLHAWREALAVYERERGRS